MNFKPSFTCLLFALLSFCSVSAMAAPNYQINVTLPVIENGQYHRPYVALWVEDKQRKAHRTLAVWMQKDKWLSDLKRFWRRVARSDRERVDAVTGATHGPGTYNLQWDGLNDHGETLAPGSYALCVEAAREKGGREALCVDFEYGTAASAFQTGEHELGRISLLKI